jgi:hypothetical protein
MVAGTLIPAAYATPRACARTAKELTNAQRAESVPAERMSVSLALARYGFLGWG